MDFYQVDQKLIVGIADIKVAKAPYVIETNLGSCIAVCLYAQEEKAGGMVHIMMPYAEENSEQARQKKAKYANTAIPELIHQMKIKFGIDAQKLKAKMFGGGKILKDFTINIGELNEQASREALRLVGIPILAAKTGGEKGYRVAFNLEDGKVRCQRFGDTIEEF